MLRIKGRCPLDPGLQVLLRRAFFGYASPRSVLSPYPLHRRNVNFRTGTDARGSTQQRRFKAGCLQSFKTRRLDFDMDVKI
ncbi:hypothetical protein HMPREF9554_01176 [Treponema phagedenis F0421]|nr:hypothetical protein HMPREF9554_01176 [Treponema phagedenis F0421]